MKHIRPAFALLIFFVLITGFAFPIAITAVSQAALPSQANGSLVSVNGKVVGSSLIGQNFADPKYLHPRPSAAGAGYDANNSSGTNLGPTNPKLLEGADGFDGVKQLAEKYRAENGLDTPVTIPADAVTRSASGLDPHISPANAKLQANRIAKERSISAEKVIEVIQRNTERPLLGVFGEDRVNVLGVNLDLDAISKPQVSQPQAKN
jgi:potassium-transporting ATPase KdpC subunit